MKNKVRSCDSSPQLKTDGFSRNRIYKDEFKYRWGQTFELLFADALVSFVNNQNKSISISSMLLNKKAIADSPIWRATNVDIDIRLNSKHLFLLKTSARERYKQIDRDALAPQMGMFNKYYIHYREHNVDTPSKAILQAQKIKSALLSNVSVLTVYDEPNMYVLFDSLIEE